MSLANGKTNGESPAPAVEWPNVYVESAALLFSKCLHRRLLDSYGTAYQCISSHFADSSRIVDSIIIYGLPDLHSLMKKGLLEEGDKNVVITYPIKTMDLLDVIMKNQEAIRQHFALGDTKLYGTALFLAKEEIENMPEGKEAVIESEIVFFDDSKSNSELVYSIAKCE